MDNETVIVLTNLQTRMVRIEQNLQIHDLTRKRQTVRNAEILASAKLENRIR